MIKSLSHKLWREAKNIEIREWYCLPIEIDHTFMTKIEIADFQQKENSIEKDRRLRRKRPYCAAQYEKTDTADITSAKRKESSGLIDNHERENNNREIKTI